MNPCFRIRNPVESVRPSEVAAPDARPEAASEATLAKQVLCAGCQHPVTSPGQAIDMGGAHEHTFRNPAAYSFHVLCYAEAPGAIVVGDPTPEASWFGGYAWSFALCGRCQQHLGWRYVGPRTFFGLIATRLLR